MVKKFINGEVYIVTNPHTKQYGRKFMFIDGETHFGHTSNTNAYCFHDDFVLAKWCKLLKHCPTVENDRERQFEMKEYYKSKLHNIAVEILYILEGRVTPNKQYWKNLRKQIIEDLERVD